MTILLLPCDYLSYNPPTALDATSVKYQLRITSEPLSGMYRWSYKSLNNLIKPTM